MFLSFTIVHIITWVDVAFYLFPLLIIDRQSPDILLTSSTRLWLKFLPNIALDNHRVIFRYISVVSSPSEIAPIDQILGSYGFPKIIEISSILIFL